jgi:hypothetical protein
VRRGDLADVGDRADGRGLVEPETEDRGWVTSFAELVGLDSEDDLLAGVGLGDSRPCHCEYEIGLRHGRAQSRVSGGPRRQM